MTTTPHSPDLEAGLRDLLARWTAAETTADGDTLGRLTVDDFHLVGPAGFVLDRDRWLQRYDDGLSTASMSLAEVSVRTYGATAISVSTMTQEATYQGHPADGTFRVTHVAVAGAADGALRLAAIHLSPVMRLPGS